jgi:hypothetical protein
MAESAAKEIEQAAVEATKEFAAALTTRAEADLRKAVAVFEAKWRAARKKVDDKKVKAKSSVIARKAKLSAKKAKTKARAIELKELQRDKASAAPKKRGAKRKVSAKGKVAASVDSTTTEVSAVAPEKKRKVGRPPKAAAEAKAEPKTTAAKPKSAAKKPTGRPRGRPPKAKVEQPAS